MKFSTAVLTAAFATSVLGAPVKFMRRDVDPALVPQFGLAAGLNPTGTGDCDGVAGPNGQPIKIPCACPPDRAVFIKSLNDNVAAGHAVNNPTVQLSFPSDNSQASQLARISASLITLQNLNGPGKGCPASSTTFVAQQKAIAAGQGAPPPPPAAAPPAAAAAPPAAAPPAAAPPAAANGNTAALAPQLGFSSGVNPTGTGDCDGAVKAANGLPVKIPCSCPPSQADFVNFLQKNIDAGKIVNNPGIPFSFPTDNSRASQAERVRASLTTLQNLFGPGKGCPAASTTLLSQLAALQ